MAATDAGIQPPLGGLYKFVREHLAVANAIVLASGTLVAALDFLAPRLSVLPKIVYCSTAAILAAMLIAGLAPQVVRKALDAVGLALKTEPTAQLWRRPAWQASVAILAGVTAVGFASVARADQGGLIASRFPELRSLQESMLGLRSEVAEIGAGVKQANDKLDRVVASVDPANVADRCADLECALQGGASSKTIKKLFERGAKVPGNPISDGELLRMAAVNHGEGRFDSVDLLFQHGVSRESKFMAIYRSPGEVTREGLRWAREVDQVAGSTRLKPYQFNPTGNADLGVWDDAQGCFYTSSGGVTLLELAGLLGDQELAAHLIQSGSKLPERPLRCEMNALGRRSAARVVFDAKTARVVRVDPD